MAKDSIVLGGGCFWCLDASYRLINGVTDVISGYAGGDMANPTYWQVAGQKTGHAEVVKVEFDTSKRSLEDILDVFWAIHDPTTPNQQGWDVGPEYRSIILYKDEAQKHVAMESLAKAQMVWDKPIVTEIKELDHFYEAEPEHQNFFNKNPEQSYCQVIINPKLKKLREKFSSMVKL